MWVMLASVYYYRGERGIRAALGFRCIVEFVQLIVGECVGVESLGNKLSWI